MGSGAPEPSGEGVGELAVSKPVQGVSGPSAALSSKTKIQRRHRLFVRGLVLPCRIGVHRHERDAPQRVRVSVELDIDDVPAPRLDAIDEVVSYDDVVRGVRQMVGADHINLVESLAEKIHKLEDHQKLGCRVKVYGDITVKAAIAD